MINVSHKRRNSRGEFAKGTSGNPGGRPVGSRNKSTMLMESLLEEKSEELLRKAVELALAGDVHAMRLCVERILPVRKERLIDLPLAPVTALDQLPGAIASVVQAVGEGRITPGEAETIVNILKVQGDVVSAQELGDRVAALEKAMSTGDEGPSEKEVLDQVVYSLQGTQRRNAAKKAAAAEKTAAENAAATENAAAAENKDENS